MMAEWTRLMADLSANKRDLFYAGGPRRVPKYDFILD